VKLNQVTDKWLDLVQDTAEPGQSPTLRARGMGVSYMSDCSNDVYLVVGLREMHLNPNSYQDTVTAPAPELLTWARRASMQTIGSG